MVGALAHEVGHVVARHTPPAPPPAKKKEGFCRCSVDWKRA